MAESDENAEFAFNLFSDIAPLLALFGDQFARQFTSESLTWADHLISALVPLGILAYITGAIRVQGPRIAKSFIGRGRENRALAEIELMSSTSNEVCELFNGKSIIRVMGKPMIAQILIYPTEYDILQKKYEEEDQKRLRESKSNDRIESNTPTEGNKSTTDRSCGIHTFETAVSQEDSRPKLLSVAEYHSHSHQIIRRIQRRLFGRSSFEDEVQSKNVFRSLGPPNLQLGLSSDQFQKGFPQKGHEILLAAVVAVVLQASLIAIATITVYHQPTRRAISFDARNYGYACYIIGSILLSIGVGVCSFAVERNTVEYDWKVLARNKRGGESAPETISATAKSVDISDSPRLLWLQKTQDVNDQAFGGYAILAGPKYHVITSSRIEDTTSLIDFPDNSTGAGVKDRNIQHTKRFYVSSGTWELITVFAAIAAGSGFVVQFIGLRGLTYPCSVAQLLAILLMALARATIRRRLGREPYHCPALSRYEIDILATRITRYPAFRNFHAGLKDQIVHMNEEMPQKILSWRVKTAKVGENLPFFCNTLQDLREANSKSGKISSTTKCHNSALIEESSSQQLLRVRERLGDLCKWHSEALESARSLVLSVEAFMDLFFPEGLTNGSGLDWAIETFRLSSEPGVERADYVTVPVTKTSKTDRWQVDIGTVEAILSLWMANIEAQAAVERKRQDEDNANRTTTRTSEQANWRRTTSGVDLQYNYCRIIGDNLKDGVLKRDLCWWVDELIAAESDPLGSDAKDLHERKNDQESEEDLFYPNNLDYSGELEHFDEMEASDDLEPLANLAGSVSEDPTVNIWTCSSARNSAEKPDLVIGFNGRFGEAGALNQTQATELAVYRSGLLPNILAQHLFTSFIWTVIQHLPKDCLRQGHSNSEQEVEIAGMHTFESHEFVSSWHRPTLRHRQLTKLVRQIEVFKLGTEKEVLLCMIPAFSVKDLLPNHVILKLVPQIRRGQGWAETARCYNRLLEQSMRVQPAGRIPEEKLCYNVVVATIDFLEFAFEPYNEYFQPPFELGEELGEIVAKIASNRFAPIIKKLIQAYTMQRRNQNIADILDVCCDYDISVPESHAQAIARERRCRALAQVMRRPIEKLDFEFLEDSLGFSKAHRPVYEALCGAQRMKAARKHQVHVGNVLTFDIFKWTPLHYASFLGTNHDEILLLYFKWKNIRQHCSLHKILDSFGRNPIHIAAISGSQLAMNWWLGCLETTENTMNAFDTIGIDGMSPLHLAAKNGNSEVIKEIISDNYMRELTGSDFWGRTAIHIAAIYGRVDITSMLLREGARIDTVDNIGKTPLKYLLEDDSELRDFEYERTHERFCKATLNENEATPVAVDEDSTLDTGPNIAMDKSRDLAKRRLKIFEQFVLKKPEFRDEQGKTFLHYAVKHTDIHTITKLLRIGYDANFKDNAGLTPLHIALNSNRPDVALKLLKGFPKQSVPGVCRSTKDVQGQTPLMFAAIHGYIDVVKYLVECYYPGHDYKEEMQLEEKKHPSSGNANCVIESPELNFGPLARDIDGQTALHLAISNEEIEVATYLLKSPNPIQEDPSDNYGNTLLVEACKIPSTEISALVLAKWPEIINKPDSGGQTPLTLACIENSDSLFDLLLEHEKLDVNIPAIQDRSHTPLHITVWHNQYSMTKKLLSHKGILVEAKDQDGNTALDMAIRFKHTRIMQALLIHPQLSLRTRLDSISQICRDGNDEVQSMILEVLGAIKNADHFRESLLELVDITEDLRSRVLFTAFASTAFSGNVWKRMPYPFHRAARINSENSKLILKDNPERLNDVDEDGWSVMEYAETYCVGDEKEPWNGGTAEDSSNVQQPRHRLPGMLHNPKHTETVQISPCNQADHNECYGNNIVRVMEPAKELICACIRTVHCAPPHSATNRYFYFEVTVHKDSMSRAFALGFCDKRYPAGSLPGMQQVSWAYRGNEGALYVDKDPESYDEWKSEPDGDFGPEAEFGEGDTVGVGLDLKTGKGLVTLNGAKRDVGDAFKTEKFNGRKMYPCVGFDVTREGVGLSFSVNFSGSDNHPFMYKGPYFED